MDTRQAAPDAAVIERGLTALVWDGIFSQAVGVLTGGTLLTGCALEYGASPGFIGLLAAIPFLAQLAQVPAIILIERLRRRRMICLAATGMARLMLLPLAAVPFVADRELGLRLLFAALAVLTPLAAVGGCAWMSWTCDLVPPHRLGSVFGGRQLRANVSGILAGLGSGAILNTWADACPGWLAGGYAGVFGLAIAAATAGIWCLARMPDMPMPPPGHTNLRALFAKPFANPNFRRLITFLGCWQFATNLALPFFPVYLVQTLQYHVTTAITLGVVGQLASIATLPLWGRMSDRRSNKAVIALCAPLFLGCLFGWALAVGPTHQALVLPFLVALQLVLGAATAGLDLACGNIAFKLAPRGEATVFLGANGLVKSLCAGIAPLAGGLLLGRLTALSPSLLPGWSLAWSGGKAGAPPVPPWPAFFMVAGILGICALTRLARIEESGETRMGVMRRLRRALGASRHVASSS